MKTGSDGDHRLHKPGVGGSSPPAATSDRPAPVTRGRAVIHRVPATEYFGWPQTSASDLKDFNSSPLGYYERKVLGQGTRKQTPALKHGENLHLWHELGESRFWDAIEVAPDSYLTATGNLSKKGEDWLAGLEPGRIGLTAVDREKLWKQTRQILANPAAKQLIDARVDAEFCVTWDWEGHAMRCRIDGATPEVFYDLKTTSDTTPLKTFWRSVLEYQYDLQAAVYESAAEAADWPLHSLHFLVTQNAPPHACHVVTLPLSVTARARDRALRLLNDLQYRRDWDSWLPTDYGTVVELECPAFMKGGSDERGEW